MRSLTAEFNGLWEMCREVLIPQQSELVTGLVKRKEDLVRHKIKDAMIQVSKNLVSLMSPEDRDLSLRGKFKDMSPEGAEIWDLREKVLNFHKSFSFSVSPNAEIVISTSEIQLGMALHYGTQTLGTTNIFSHIDHWWQDCASKEGVDIIVVSSPELRVSL